MTAPDPVSLWLVRFGALYGAVVLVLIARTIWQHRHPPAETRIQAVRLYALDERN